MESTGGRVLCDLCDLVEGEPWRIGSVQLSLRGGGPSVVWPFADGGCSRLRGIHTYTEIVRRSTREERTQAGKASGVTFNYELNLAIARHSLDKAASPLLPSASPPAAPSPGSAQSLTFN